MTNFFNNGLKEDDWWSEEGGFEEVHLYSIRQPVGTKTLPTHLREEDIGVWQQEVTIREVTMLLAWRGELVFMRST
jgi:hypothetical protein